MEKNQLNWICRVISNTPASFRIGRGADVNLFIDHLVCWLCCDYINKSTPEAGG